MSGMTEAEMRDRMKGTTETVVQCSDGEITLFHSGIMPQEAIDECMNYTRDEVREIFLAVTNSIEYDLVEPH